MQPEQQPGSALPQPSSVRWTVFEFHQEYSVGIRTLDQHHQRIFELLNRLYETMLQQQGRPALLSALAELIGYTSRHFAAEELLMQAFGYPETEPHQLEHERLSRVLAEFQHQFADGREHLVEPLLDFMEGWLIRHILAWDRRYSTFFAERGAIP
jgi:hemerythrin-like metal-binding protein